MSKTLTKESTKSAPISFDNCPVKVSFTDCPVADRLLFGHSNCIMPISVGLGLEVNEGIKFFGTMKLINSSFKSFTILLDDSIQRYTMGILSDASEDQLYKAAMREGDLWLQRNKYVFDLITIPYHIMRWDDWTHHPDYQTQRQIIEKFYETDALYRRSIQDTIEEFLVRYKRNIGEERLHHFDYEHAYKLCLMYLKEECSVMCLWAKELYDFEVYPSGRNMAMSATHDKVIKPNLPNHLKSVSLHFRKYKNLMQTNNVVQLIS